jgi:23S rRNA (uridine2552-2'-O)-methyltransferase
MPKPYNPHDKWMQLAKSEGFRARSVYKLQELDERYKLFKPAMNVLDIGAAPGSWLQYASKQVGPKGKVLGVDLKEIEFVADNVVTAVCDVFDPVLLKKEIRKLGWKWVDLIISDIAPNTSGIKDVDQWKSVELNQKILDVARYWLRPRATLVMKVFRGKDFDSFLAGLKMSFQSLKIRSVDASRDSSKEVYVICTNMNKSARVLPDNHPSITHAQPVIKREEE